ncbi:MAG: hypothetical protein P1S60_05325 [Anaerolineae bacterium]|nr:hypothetical protein [Anaerolineae bacterium]
MSEICRQLHELFNVKTRLRFPFDETAIPLNGVYILFEKGEYAHNMDRIVRVGSHTGADNLRKRLHEHFLNENKDRSIFRKHIGRALLVKADDPFLEQWEWDLTSRAAKDKYDPLLDRAKQDKVETLVTAYIRDNFSFTVFRVDEKNIRLEIEKALIGTLSNCHTCRPSPSWLGLHSPYAKIRESGLWHIQHLYKRQLSQQVYELYKAYFA